MAEKIKRDRTFRRVGTCCDRDNPLLLIFLQSTPVRDVAFERLITALRASLANDAIAGKPVAEPILGFACTLAHDNASSTNMFSRRRPKKRQRSTRSNAHSPVILRARCRSLRSRCMCRCTRCRPLRRCSTKYGIRISRRIPFLKRAAPTNSNVCSGTCITTQGSRGNSEVAGDRV